MKGLTKRQRELIDFIQDFISSNRYSPSYREIGNHFGFASLGSVYKHINTLKKKGALFSESKVSRSVTTVEEPVLSQEPNELTVPLIGYIAAGMPIETFSQSQQIQVPASFVHSPDKTYALRAQGDSLLEEMIADGDVLLVEVRQYAHPGETVVALINGHDIIVKKYYPEGELVRLLSTHSHHNPILLRQEDIVVQAVVVSLLRMYG
ncbi:MAG TPA: transcriptional repressor LexA [Parachlamydiaceae bacterium]|nr:transcriptional repressor LexA [Parachlamydiaceae bacterium]